MGKKGGKKGNAAAATSAPRCTCDDPFNCSCGNRPERPSRGHKWDPETQQWSGKGHKQKGASGQTALVGQQAETTTVGKTQVAQWQKLPSTILHEWCQKQKRPRPKFKELLNDPTKTKFKARVIVPDPKNDSDKDLILIPSAAVSNEEQANEEAALLALLHLTPNLPHERKLPEPYKTTWLNTIQAQKDQAHKAASKNRSNVDITVSRSKGPTSSSASSTSSGGSSRDNGGGGGGCSRGGGGGGASSSSKLSLATTFTSAAERRKQADARRMERNARIRKHEAVRMANRDHPVFLSAKLRSQIQRLLRGDDDAQNGNMEDDDGDGGETDAIALDTFESDLQAYVEERLHHEGFTQRQARTAFETNKKDTFAALDEEEWEHVYEDCLQWLCVHLDEDHLPEGFDPRGATLEIVAPSQTKASRNGNGNSSSNNNNQSAPGAAGDVASGAALVAERFGISVRDARWLQEEQKEQGEKNKEEIFWDRTCQIAGVTLDGPSTDADDDNNDSMAQEEFEAIEAIFPDECKKYANGQNGATTIVIQLSDGINILFTFHKSYPSIFPTQVLFLGKWTSPVGVAFHVEIAKFLSSLTLGEPMLFEIYGHAMTLLESLDELPKGLSLSSPSSPEPESQSSSAKAPEIATSTPTFGATTSSRATESTRTAAKKRPRARGTFWSLPPNKTTPAKAFGWSKSMELQRKSLPAWKARGEFLSILDEACKKGSRVVLVTGATGCGKTTQIPQFILEENAASAKIVVAQPRRLAATGVAGRVAEERGENQPGTASVGYVVRGATAVCKDTRLLFCTFGILLRQLQSEGALDSISHIVIDEVHERTLDGDILMGLLRDSLKTNPHLKVILMSATLDADRFASYWGNAPRMHIPGRTFPVQDFMLEDVLERTGYNPPKKKRKQGRFNGGSGGRPVNRKTSAWDDSEKLDPEEEEEGQVDMGEHNDGEALTDDVAPPECGVPLEERVKRVDQESVDYDLLGLLVKHVVQTNAMGSDGSILVFMQGVGEISQAKTVIGKITRGMPLLLLPLHGGLQPKDQQLVFRKTPGQVKVILSTNVAETSITIPDCTVVIDSCREKQSSYDPVNRMPLLLDQLASKASLKQRRGRAGRVREGKCFKLISKATFASLKDHSAPEISRCALDQTLLSLLFLGAEDGSGRFLQNLLDPPSQKAIKSAILSLQKLGAVQLVRPDKMDLTPLGMHLAGIPAPPTIGKLLVMGCILGCRTGAIAMAAALSVGRSPLLRVDFTNREGDSGDTNRSILQKRAQVLEQCGNSDHAMLATIVATWQSLDAGGDKRKQYCEMYGLSFNGMKDIAQLASQYNSSLSTSGFPPSKEGEMNAQSWRVLRTCAVASMAPDQLVKVVRPSTKYEDTAEGARLKDGEAKGHKFFIRVDSEMGQDGKGRPKEERVFIHPSSALFSVGTYSCPWLVFHSMIRTSKPFLRDATECSAYSLLLFGGPLRVEARNNIIAVDAWVQLSANARIGALIQGLRSKMDGILQSKIDDPSIPVDHGLMQLIVKLLITDGLG